MLSASIVGILCGVVGLMGYRVMAAFDKIDAFGGKMLGLHEDVMGVILMPTIGGVFVGMLCI